MPTVEQFAKEGYKSREANLEQPAAARDERGKDEPKIELRTDAPAAHSYAVGHTTAKKEADRGRSDDLDGLVTGDSGEYRQVGRRVWRQRRGAIRSNKRRPAPAEGAAQRPPAWNCRPPPSAERGTAVDPICRSEMAQAQGEIVMERRKAKAEPPKPEPAGWRRMEAPSQAAAQTRCKAPQRRPAPARRRPPSHRSLADEPPSRQQQ